MMRRSRPIVTSARTGTPEGEDILICLLGSFRVLQNGKPLQIHHGGKAEALLTLLALRCDQLPSRDAILDVLWPQTEPVLAAQTLSSLLHSMQKQLRSGPDRLPAIVHAEGYYRLRTEAGVEVDVHRFDALVRAAEECERASDETAAMAGYGQAVELYSGDLCVGNDVHAIVERERLRARFLTLLARLADHAYARREYAACLHHALQLLAGDPCREDAHRFVMCCHVRLGERAQALRQYQVCETVLRTEFGTAPEPATAALYERIRSNPDSI